MEDERLMDLKPQEIVSELDKYIIGQKEAKRAVAIALRNRWRRQNVSSELKDEIYPKNIIMIGSTGVGKTEIARRLAQLAGAPFIKVEATKYTEVGYVGKDVESMVRDLTEIAVTMMRKEEKEKVAIKARDNAEERILDLLIPPVRRAKSTPSKTEENNEENNLKLEEEENKRTREKFRIMLKEGKLDARKIELDVQDQQVFPMIEIFSPQGFEGMDMNMRDMLGNIFPKKKKRRKVEVKDAFPLLTDEEAQKLIDMDKVTRMALDRVQNLGIIFIDEIDKIAGKSKGGGPDVSREGVQRDILPIVEGCNVTTKYGVVKTDHVLFIAAGAFHIAKPSDLIPELQGRFPIRVELDTLKKDDFIRILTEPKNSLIKQYTALMATENITLKFEENAISEISEIACVVNERTQNIGARRLHTIMEKLLDELSFAASNHQGDKIVVDRNYVKERLDSIVKNEDLSRYIL